MRGIDGILTNISAGKVQPLYLISGDMVVAEPTAQRLAQALAESVGCEVERLRRPAKLSSILTDLNTYSLFASAKVTLVIDSAVLADRRAAADLIDQASDVLPIGDAEAELTPKQREGASRLFQALHVFSIDPQAAKPSEVLASLPDWAFQGGQAFRKKKPRGRSKKAARELCAELAELLEAALQNGMQGFAEGDLSQLAAILQRGLPEGHALVLAESSVAENHPLVDNLKGLGAFFDVGRLEVGRGGEWQGLHLLGDELERETGVGIARDALTELANRTLRQKGDWNNRSVGADSTARFAAEYRKLANLAAGKKQITRAMVEESTEDRGEEDVWQILDAIGQGRGEEALSRYRRYLGAAEDQMAARLSFFALLAGFCRQLAALGGMLQNLRLPGRAGNYNVFKSRWAPELQKELPYGSKNPLSGIHPFRLFRVYQAASRLPAGLLVDLPWWVLETEQRVKGESSEADIAVGQLITRLTTASRR